MRRYLPLIVLFATCFGVFVLPFFFPAPLIQGISVSNIAGFNNKVAAIAAATMGVAVFILALRKDWFDRNGPATGDYRPLSRRMIFITVGLCTLLIACFSTLIVDSHFRFLYDSFYFIQQISMHADYGRKLYDQIEFPYGPFLFYAPILIRSVLSPFHVSLPAAYFLSFVIEHALGLTFLAWILNSLPIPCRWRKLLFFAFAIYVYQPNFGVNYTFFRFATAAAGVVLLSRQKTRARFALALFAVQVLCLGISPEMGFGFFAASLAYALWHVYSEGRTWLICAAAPFVATGFFLLLAGGGYVRMLALFSRGVFNFIVEPLPPTLFFLFAFVWLIPPVLAKFFREHRPEAPLMAALYVLSIALLPVAFGRADPGHIFFNQIPIYILSMVAIGYSARWRQNLWALCTVFILLWPYFTSRYPIFVWQEEMVVRRWLFRPDAGIVGRSVAHLLRQYSPAVFDQQYRYDQRDNMPFDIAKLRQIVGPDPVATPFEIPLTVEDALKRYGQFTPSIYCFTMDIFDRSAEINQIDEFNNSRWAMLRKGITFKAYETPALSAAALGFYLPYHEKHPPYVVGNLFDENLATNWQRYAEIDDYVVYKRR